MLFLWCSFYRRVKVGGDTCRGYSLRRAWGDSRATSSVLKTATSGDYATSGVDGTPGADAFAGVSATVILTRSSGKHALWCHLHHVWRTISVNDELFRTLNFTNCNTPMCFSSIFIRLETTLYIICKFWVKFNKHLKFLMTLDIIDCNLYLRTFQYWIFWICFFPGDEDEENNMCQYMILFNV